MKQDRMNLEKQLGGKDMFLMDLWKKYRKTVVTLSVAGAVLAAGCGGAQADNAPKANIPETSRPAAAAAGNLSDARNTPAVRVAKAVGPAVVGNVSQAAGNELQAGILAGIGFPLTLILCVVMARRSAFSRKQC